MENKFTEEDKTKLVELLNFIAERATFPGWKTNDTVKHFKLLAHVQQVILPKIEANVMEIKRVIEDEKPKTKTRKKP